MSTVLNTPRIGDQPVLLNQYIAVDLPRLQAEPIAAAPETAASLESDSWVDSLASKAGYGAAGTNAVGTILTLPHEALKAADAISDLVRSTRLQQGLLQLARSEGVLASAGSRLMTGSVQLIEGSQRLSTVAKHVMKAPLIGRLTQPHVAKVLTEKVLPVVNAVGCSVAIYDNTKKLHKANQADNRTAQVVAGLQIGLNVVSGVTGFLPGRAQVVSAVTGFGSLALDVAGWTTGFGQL